METLRLFHLIDFFLAKQGYKSPEERGGIDVPPGPPPWPGLEWAGKRGWVAIDKPQNSVINKPQIQKPFVRPKKQPISQEKTARRAGVSSKQVSSRIEVSRVNERAWLGQSINIQNKPTKQEIGALGEEIALNYLKSRFPDVRKLNTAQTNAPVDMVGDHTGIEIKTGLASNGYSAQHWRATIGQPGPSETQWMKTLSKEALKEWNYQKSQKILERKEQERQNLSKAFGYEVKPLTIGIIIDPDKQIADIYEFDGFHLLISWRNQEAQKHYKGSFHYD